MVYFDQILHTHACQCRLTTGMYDGRGFVDNQGRLVSDSEMLITLEPYNIFGLKFAYLSSHWCAKGWRGLAEQHDGLSRAFSENAHNSRTL